MLLGRGGFGHSIVFDLGLLFVFLFILLVIPATDIAECAQPFQLGVLFGIALGGECQRGLIALPLLVGGDVANRMLTCELRLEDLLQHPAVHILGNGQAQVVQDGGGDVEHRSTRDFLGAAQVGTGGDEDAVFLVIEVGLLDVNHLLAADAPLAALEAVVGEHEDGRLLQVDPGQDSTQELVLVLVPLLDHVLVAGEALLVVDPGQPGRRVLHEKVREAVHLFEVKHEEVVGLIGEQLLGDGGVALRRDRALLEEVDGVGRVRLGIAGRIEHLLAVLLVADADEALHELGPKRVSVELLVLRVRQEPAVPPDRQEPQVLPEPQE